jgi:hypothetical protein
MTGAVTSLTVTVKLQLAELPAASVAVATTVVVPNGKTEPDALLVTTVGAEQLSLALTVKLTEAEHVPEGALTVMLAGQAMVGFCVSLTVTLKVQVGPTELVQVTVVSPNPKVDPEGWSHVTVPQAAPEGSV